MWGAWNEGNQVGFVIDGGDMIVRSLKKGVADVAQVADELRSEGLNTHYFRYDFEISGHPSRVQSARMAQELYEFILSHRLV